MDKYSSFEYLARSESDGSFAVRVREGTSGCAVMAPHGGGIEPGTSEVADYIAGREHSYYAFEGRKPTRNRDLHITSTNFDEPEGVALACRSERVLTIHGCSGGEKVVYVGGLDADLIGRVRKCLIESGFTVEEHTDPALQGKHPSNICNSGRTQRGEQLELSVGLRDSMFDNLRRRDGRERTTEVFDVFVSALREAVAELQEKS